MLIWLVMIPRPVVSCLRESSDSGPEAFLLPVVCCRLRVHRIDVDATRAGHACLPARDGAACLDWVVAVQRMVTSFINWLRIARQ